MQSISQFISCIKRNKALLLNVCKFIDFNLSRIFRRYKCFLILFQGNGILLMKETDKKMSFYAYIILKKNGPCFKISVFIMRKPLSVSRQFSSFAAIPSCVTAILPIKRAEHQDFCAPFLHFHRRASFQPVPPVHHVLLSDILHISGNKARSAADAVNGVYGSSL